jgi:hypothetical protein
MSGPQLEKYCNVCDSSTTRVAPQLTTTHDCRAREAAAGTTRCERSNTFVTHHRDWDQGASQC